MNFEFEAALRYIDLGSYDKAVEMLKTSIEKESEDPGTAAQIRCVLGELYANLGNTEEARAEFEKVLDYCDQTNTLAKQRVIAQTYIDAFNGKLPPKVPQEHTKRPGYVPLVPKPVQDRGFIAKQSRKNHR